MGQTLSERQIEQVSREGYLLLEGVLDEELDLAPVDREYAEILDRLASRLYAEGKISQTIPDEWIPEGTTRPAPARRGSVLLHLPMTKHRSFDNLTNDIHWSFDLRHQRTGEPTGRSTADSSRAAGRRRPLSWQTSRDGVSAGNGPGRAWSGRLPVTHRWTTEAAACA